MTVLRDDWEFNVLGVHNYRKPGKLDFYYDWIRNNHKTVEGDIAEAGVYKGSSLLATAMLLKELGSDKKVLGFDSFSGFPPVYHEYDDLVRFGELRSRGVITQEHYDAHLKLVDYRSFLKGVNVSVRNISSSEEFDQANLEKIKSKAQKLCLDNIEFYSGSYEESMRGDVLKNRRLCAGLLDCDLYNSYKISLPFIWSRLSEGGMVFLDEYYSLKFPGARIFCDEFFSSKNVRLEMAQKAEGEFERWYAVKNN